LNAQDLKNSILQLAIQGRLVEQRAEEGTAKELLEQIKAEKEQLIKEGTIKREKPLPEIAEDEIPFEIPESWEWIRLENVMYNIGNKNNQIKQSEILVEGKFPVISQSMNRVEGYSEDESKLLYISPLEVIVFGDHSKTLKLIDFDFIIGADGTKIMVPISLYPKYLYCVLKYNVINMTDRGYSRHYQFLKQKLVPLPPLGEQKRIVAKLESLMPYVEKYGAAHAKLEAFNKQFPEDMQKSILQYAIQGKLVEQREEEGTAGELYQQIQAEKAKLIKEGKSKKEKPLPEITVDEISFEVPESWKWIRICDLGYFSSGKTPAMSEPQYWKNGNFPWVTSKDMKRKYIDRSEMMITEKAVEQMAVYPRGTLLMVVRSGILKRLLPLAILKVDSTINQDLKAFTLYDNSMSEYVYWTLKAMESYILKEYRKQVTTVDSLKFDEFQIMPLPLPPMKEQNRIVAKIEEMLPYCQQLVK